MILQAFAVGVLSANALTNLLPTGFAGEFNTTIITSNSRIYKSAAGLLMLTMFFAIDIITGVILVWHRSGKAPQLSLHNCQCESTIETNVCGSETTCNLTSIKNQKKDKKSCRFTNLNTEAILIVVGDSIHNFIDGIVIATQFSVSISQGISTSISVLAEEFPHELGDFTVLLKSNIGFGGAIIWNLISSFTSYIGALIVLSIGSVNDVVVYYFEIICGVVFFYISVKGIFPLCKESMMEMSQNSLKRFVRNMIFSLISILCGQAFILGMVFLGEKIQL